MGSFSEPKLIQVIRYSVNIAKVDTQERGGGGDGLAKDIHHKGEGQEVISVGFSFNPAVHLERLPPRLGGKKMACLALKLGHEEIAVLGHFCVEARAMALGRSYYLVPLTMQYTVLLKSYEEDINQIPSGSNNHYYLGDFCRQTIETSKR